ncbi:hypothetical protein M413DRAFT_24163 [Hebeloma cylindrosporum]|uniref:SET domain-containing protein n=1 Tax=Hebeloma cylindrosporum TaxID=76867 RepID=A0A0C3CCC8_HEBCY|nr:hypothetical protein M413DRAFT_24163 [Hebeloma cylindrosporum h7]
MGVDSIQTYGLYKVAQCASGSHVIATVDLPKDSTIVSCPLELVITQSQSQKAVLRTLGINEKLEVNKDWSERQWISTYLSLHSIAWQENESAIGQKDLLHLEYLQTLPNPEKLRTPLHYSQSELELFKGTNLYGATLDRQRDWKQEWGQCREFISQANPRWGELFTWEKYLTSATYLSSRAFPSTLLSPNPSLVSSPSTQPILIPGVDALNHARGHPVSWLVTFPDDKGSTDGSPPPIISLVIHSSGVRGQELFNNYGPKPNSELILGYGFSIAHNPDDTIVLKIGGIGGNKWEIGRNAQGVDGLWKEILSNFCQPSQEGPTYEDVLDASGTLQEMV